MVAAMLIANILRSHGTSLMEIWEIATNSAYITEQYCQVRVFIQISSFNFSMFLSVCLAVLRAYICIKMMNVKLTKRAARTIICISAVIGCILAASGIVNGVPLLKSCTLRYDQSANGGNSVYWAKVCFIAALCIIVLGCYVSIGVLIWLKKRHFQCGKNDLFTVKFGVCLALVFALTHISPFLGKVLIPVPYEANPLRTAHLVRYFSWVSYINTMLDPIIFAAQNRYFRKYLRSLMCKNSVDPAVEVGNIQMVS